MENDLYQAILGRRSVRRYDKEPLGEPELAQVHEVLSGIRPLIVENRLEVLLKDVLPGEDLVAILGAYGRLVTPPHYLVPYVTGERHLLVDMGFRVEQVAVRLAALGIGTCYVGTLSRETEVRARFEMPEGARIGAFLAFGWPSTARRGRLVNRVVRRAAGATNKLAVERVFFRDSFDIPARPPAELAPLIEAARNAPSAVNAQPWRLLWRDGCLYLFVLKASSKYGSGPGANYRFYDGGICMSNVALALEALGQEGQWQVFAGDEDDLPAHPPDLQPLAFLDLPQNSRRARRN
jgi:nitroreductase